MNNDLFADLIGLCHAFFVLFVVMGQALILIGWRSNWFWTQNIYFRVVHLTSIVIVVFLAWSAIPCPLTLIEADLRGISTKNSFIGYWLQRLLYYQLPSWVFTLIYSLFGFLVLFTFFVYPPKND